MLKSLYRNDPRQAILCVIVWGGLIALVPSLGDADEVHKWTDKTGKFSIEAQFVSEKDGKVTLVTTEGEELEIPLDQLSKADQDFVSKQKSDSPFKSKSKSPFQPKGTPSVPMKEDSAAGPVSGGVVDDTGRFESRLVDVDITGAAAVGLPVDNAEWQLVPQAGTSEAIRGKKRPISVPPKTSFHEKGTKLVFNRSGTHAVVGYKLDFPGDTEITRLVLCDLKTGRTVTSRSTGGLLKPLALSDDGATVVMGCDEFGHGKADRLEIWSLSNSAIHKGSAWIPYGDNEDVDWADFLADGTLVTAGAGTVIAWGVPALEALWTAPLGVGCTPGISPDGRYLVLADREQLSVIDVQLQEIVASQKAPSGAFPKFAFADSGNRFACATTEGVTVWETADGAVYRDLDFAGFPSMGIPVAPVFANDETLLIGHRYLVDLSSLIPLWEYSRQLLTAGHGGACWFVAADGDKKQGVLFGADLPHPPVVDALAKAQADANFFVVKPGSSIKLNLDAISDPQQREALRTSLVERLHSNEMSVAESAPVELVVSYDPVKEINVVFQGFGGTQAVDFKETVSRIKLVSSGQTLWESKSSNRPFSVQRKDGESLQEAVRRYEKPGTVFFERVKLPRLLARPDGKSSATLGSSTVTTSGIR